MKASWTYRLQLRLKKGYLALAHLAKIADTRDLVLKKARGFKA